MQGIVLKIMDSIRSKRLAVCTLGLLALCQTGYGEEYSFVLPRILKRHASQDFPEIIPFAKVLTAPGSIIYARPLSDPWMPAMDGIQSLHNPLTLSAQSGLAGTIITAGRAEQSWKEFTLAAAYRHERQHAYKNAQGNAINTDLQRDTEYLLASTNPDRTSRLKMIAIRDLFSDSKVPHYNLDAPELERVYCSVSNEAIPLEGFFKSLDLKASWSQVDLNGNNFSLRPPGSAQIAVDADIDMLWFSSRLTRPDGSWLTMEAVRERYTANRFAQEYGPDIISAIRMPDARTEQLSIEVGQRGSFTPMRLEAAIRSDLRRTAANRLDSRPEVPGPPGTIYNITPQELYLKYYGFNDSGDQSDHEISARMRLEYEVAPGSITYLDLRRNVRFPELTELYYANTGTGILLQIGNPELKAEKHHKVEWGAKLLTNGYKQYGRGGTTGSALITISGYWDQMQDFIMLDHARGQPGILTSDGGFIYRNVDARLTGMATDLRYNAFEGVSLRLHVSGQHGRDLDDRRPLYQVPPLEANLFLDLFGIETLWNAGIRQRWVAAKNATDSSITTGTGQDRTGPTQAFSVTDVYGGYQVSSQIALSWELHNVFNQGYREFIAEPPQTPTSMNPDAPGRTVLLRLMAAF